MTVCDTTPASVLDIRMLDACRHQHTHRKNVTDITSAVAEDTMMASVWISMGWGAEGGGWIGGGGDGLGGGGGGGRFGSCALHSSKKTRVATIMMSLS